MTSATPLTYDFTGTVVTYTVPVTGIYDIIAFGAQGGGVATFAGGLGAEVSVDVTLTAGSVLDILVGGQGAAGAVEGAGGGGGGGSFVAEANGTATPTLLAAAGGGGGAFDAGFAAGAGTNASIGSQGTSPGGGGLGNVGGSNGGGGGADGVLAGAGGGGGFTGNGQSDQNGSGAVGGLSFTAYLGGQTNPYAGGFGGGGQGASLDGATGGGGGGYSGGGAGGNGDTGDAAAPGGGGGSFFALNALSVTLAGGVQSGNGEVEIAMVCFLGGTRIATPDGEVAVETLRAGDHVLTTDGRAAPLIWTGRRRVRAAARLDRALHHPVRVRADAVAPGVPRRDLLVTGDHALFIDGRLIPARLLVNGASIVAERGMTAFTYYHLELARHDLLLAEGLAAESYLDTGNRHVFAPDGVGVIAPAADVDTAAIYAARGVAPLTLAPALVEPVWRRLAARAGVDGALAADVVGGQAVPHLVADGRRIEALCVAGERHVFMVPAGTRRVCLASVAARPSDRRAWLDDRRRLGVRVRRVRLRTGAEVEEIPLDGPALGAGWHGVEAEGGRIGRWTDGAGMIALPPGAGADAARVLDVWIAGGAAAAAEMSARAA